MSNYRQHAERELRDWITSGDPMSRSMAKDVLELLDVFARQGRSGFSASIAVRVFEKLARFEPIGSLTGEDDEWRERREAGPDGLQQNVRCGHVFRDVRVVDGRAVYGQAFDTRGRVFRYPNGLCYTSSDSRVPVVFPYSPVIEYVDVPRDDVEENRTVTTAMKKVVYIAHPLSGPDRAANLARAARWCSWAARAEGVAPVATWIALASVWDESDENRALGLECDVAALERCDELWLVGGRVSGGMEIERAAAEHHGVVVRDLTHLGEEPPVES